MYRTDYTDDAGRRFAVLLPDGAPASDARMGIPVGPLADLASLRLPFDVEIALHNELHARQIFTARDAKRRRREVEAALMAALKVDAGRILDAFAALEAVEG